MLVNTQFASVMRPESHGVASKQRMIPSQVLGGDRCRNLWTEQVRLGGGAIRANNTRQLRLAETAAYHFEALPACQDFCSTGFLQWWRGFLMLHTDATSRGQVTSAAIQGPPCAGKSGFC